MSSAPSCAEGFLPGINVWQHPASAGEFLRVSGINNPRLQRSMACMNLHVAIPSCVSIGSKIVTQRPGSTVNRGVSIIPCSETN